MYIADCRDTFIGKPIHYALASERSSPEPNTPVHVAIYLLYLRVMLLICTNVVLIVPSMHKV